MKWFSSVNLDPSETEIKQLIQSLLRDKSTVIDVDSDNKIFMLSNSRNACNVYLDNLGVQIDIELPEKKTALDRKVSDTNLAHLKQLIANENTLRVREKHEKTFVNRIRLLKDVTQIINNNNNTENS